MPTTRSTDGTEIRWTERGSGSPLLLIHGYASNLERNWEGTGWIDAAAKRDLRAVAYDQRGHGRSGKRYEPEAYSLSRLVEDVVAVLQAAAIPRAALFGYSMGARVALETAIRRPDRVAALVLSGIGAGFHDLGDERSIDRELVTRALAADDPSGLPEWARAYRRFADQNQGDRRALAACWRRTGRRVETHELAAIAAPTLVVAGDRDEVAGDPRPLAQAIPGAELVVLARKDHMKAVGAREHREAVFEFLARVLR